MDIKNALTTLGLTKHEVRVYLALLKRGATQAGPIIKNTRLHRMLVYNALDALTERGLVSVTHKNKIKVFQPNDPEALNREARRLANVAHNAVPELRKLRVDVEEVVDVQTYIGHEGFRHALINVIDSAAAHTPKDILVTGGAPAEDFYYAAGDWYDDYVSYLSKKKVWKRLIAPAKTAAGFEQFRSEKYTKLRIIDKGLQTPTYTRVTPDLVSIEMYRPQIVVIQIRNAAIAAGYIDTHKLLWKTAKRAS